MITRIISGGQTGADQAGLRAAKRHGFKTGGFAPKLFMTEDGPTPSLADFGLIALDSMNYPLRTKRNVQIAHYVIWFGNPYSPGGKCTLGCCHKEGKPYFTVVFNSSPKDVAGWIYSHLFEGVDDRPRTIMIAGNRESTNPGIGQMTEEFLDKLFPLLKELKGN